MKILFPLTNGVAEDIIQLRDNYIIGLNNASYTNSVSCVMFKLIANYVNNVYV